MRPVVCMPRGRLQGPAAAHRIRGRRPAFRSAQETQVEGMDPRALGMEPRAEGRWRRVGLGVLDLRADLQGQVDRLDRADLRGQAGTVTELPGADRIPPPGRGLAGQIAAARIGQVARHHRRAHQEDPQARDLGCSSTGITGSEIGGISLAMLGGS